MSPTILSLCSGYGGLDLAVEAVFGAVTIAHAEFEDAPSAVLAVRWPGVPNLGDITRIDWSGVKAHIITAGYPCQPFSLGGHRKGAKDDRHLWPDIAEAIRRVRPRYVVLENVAGHRSLGLDAVLGDLAALGYDAVWTSLRAADVGAPHARERLFVVAPDADRIGWPGRTEADQERRQDRSGSRSSTPGPVWGAFEPAIRRWERVLGRVAPAPTDAGPKGGQRLSPLFVEWMMGLPAGWVTDVPDLSRNAQLKMLGNGVVPQQAIEALRRMLPVIESLSGAA